LIILDALSQAKTNFSRAILGGHSRGGQLAFRIMSDAGSGDDYNFIGVIGVDPVDGGRSVCVNA
jgi:pimeloyl-ACP methyl ester carboxylesterase